VDRDKLRRRTTTITKSKKIRMMSKVLNAKNNLPDTFRVLEKDWPLSKNDGKLTKKQQDHQDALDNFFKKMDEDVVEWNKFLNRVWSNRAKMPTLHPEKSLYWEACIREEKLLQLLLWKMVHFALFLVKISINFRPSYSTVFF
jgi:hypothetical protein